MAEPAIDLAPELGPEVEVTARAAPRIGLVAILCVVLGMILAVEAIVRGFFGTISGAVGWIPYAGSVLEESIKAIEQKIVSMLAGLEQDIDRSIAHNIHVAARLLDQLWHTLEYMAANIVLLGALGTAALFHYLIHPLERFVRGAIRKVEEEIRRVERQVIREGAKVTHVVVHNIFPRVRGAEVKIERFVETAIRPLEKTAHEALRISKRVEKRVNKLERSLGSKAFLAALTGAIGELAVQALKCTELGSLFKNRGCNLWRWIDDLLGLVISLLALETVCEFLPLIEDAFGAIAGPMVHLLNEVPLGACEKVPDGWAKLSVANGPLPPAQSLGPFPS